MRKPGRAACPDFSRPHAHAGRCARGRAFRRPSLPCGRTWAAAPPSAPFWRRAWGCGSWTWACPSCLCTPFARWGGGGGRSADAQLAAARRHGGAACRPARRSACPYPRDARAVEFLASPTPPFLCSRRCVRWRMWAMATAHAVLSSTPSAPWTRSSLDEQGAGWGGRQAGAGSVARR